MVFTLLPQERQAALWKRMVDLKFPPVPTSQLLKMKKKPKPVEILDITFGSGGLEWDLLEDPRYNITKCDLIVTKANRKNKDQIIVKDILRDSYLDLGKKKFDVIVVDFAYLINRDAFDYMVNVRGGKLVSQDLKEKMLREDFNNGTKQPYPIGSHADPLTGPRSWGSQELSHFVQNGSVDEFNLKFHNVNCKMPPLLKDTGMLAVKVMDVRHERRLIKHHIDIDNALTNFELDDIGIYPRIGPITWTLESNLQNLHGYFMLYRKKGYFDKKARAKPRANVTKKKKAKPQKEKKNPRSESLVKRAEAEETIDRITGESGLEVPIVGKNPLRPKHRTKSQLRRSRRKGDSRPATRESSSGDQLESLSKEKQEESQLPLPTTEILVQQRQK